MKLSLLKTFSSNKIGFIHVPHTIPNITSIINTSLLSNTIWNQEKKKYLLDLGQLSILRHNMNYVIRTTDHDLWPMLARALIHALSILQELSKETEIYISMWKLNII